MQWRRPGAAAVVTTALLVAGCSADDRDAARSADSPRPSASPVASPSTDPSPAPCSGATAAPLAPQQLPVQVAATRAAVAEAARACDYAALDALAQTGRRTFTYSFGGGGAAARSWREQEQRGERPLWTLVEVLGRQHRERPQEGQHVWPAAFGYGDWSEVPQEARDELRGLHGEQDLAGFAQLGAYAGYRVGIADDGEWLFFVAGD